MSFVEGAGGFFQIHFWMQPSVCPPFSQSYVHLAKMSRAKLLFSRHSFPSTASWHCLKLVSLGMWVSVVSGQEEELLKDKENIDKRFPRERLSIGVGSMRRSGGHIGFLLCCCRLYDLTDNHYESEHEGQR